MGELAALASSLCWAVASLLFAKLGRGVGPLAMNLAKCALAFVLLSATLVVLRGEPWPTSYSTRDLGWIAASGVVGLGFGDTLFFAALARLGARRTLTLLALSPVITALVAYPALGEALSLSMLGGMALTLAGVTWVVRERNPVAAPADDPAREVEGPPPSGTATDVPGILLGVGAAACQAVAYVLVKLGGAGHEALPSSVVRLAAGTLGLLVVVALRGRLSQAITPFRAPRTAGLLFVATLIGTYLGIWLQVAGLNGAEAGVAATLSSTAPIFVLPLGFVVASERPSARAVLGAAVAVLGIAVLFIF